MRKSYSIVTLLAIIIAVLTSCTGNDYRNSIPSNSTALIAINPTEFVGKQSPFASLLTPFVDEKNKRIKGVDLTKEIYLFISGDGNLGLCAPLADAEEFDDFMQRLVTLDIASCHTKNGDKDFYSFNKQWVVGHDDNTLLVAGPVIGADAEARLKRRMAKLIEKSEDQNVTRPTLWEHLDEQQGNIRMVAQADVLPEQIAASVSLGAPRGTSTSDVLIEANMTYSKGTLTINGHTCSYNLNVKQALKRMETLYKPITIDWEKNMNDSAFIGFFMNIDGKELTPYIAKNTVLNTMLIGTDAYDQIYRNKGDMAVMLTPNKVKDGTLFCTEVTSLPAGNVKSNDKLIVAINIDAIKGQTLQALLPFLGKVKRIVYNMNSEEYE
ncbi:MAG: DUF4836 family protein [Prevotellaceae bacterium]|nr:DUF4836 family protein [Prevotellaceae bacterium]MDO4932122.1 DUF4836 family protein [Prevotellaceae bacterium]